MRNDQDGKKALTNIIHQCFDSLKLYGKEPEQLDNANKLFHFILSDYPIEKIKDAFKWYLRHNSEMPAPADIAQIIDRGNRPPWDRAVYVSLTRKRPDERTSEEWEYIRGFEEFSLRG